MNTLVTIADLNTELRDRFRALLGPQVIWVDAGCMVPDLTSPCDPLTSITTTAGNPLIMGIGFSGTTDQAAQWRIALPKQWNKGTIRYRVRWASPNAAAGGVVFYFTTQPHSDGDLLDSAWGTAVTVADTFIGAKYVHVSPMSDPVTISGAADGDSITFYLARSTGNASDTKTDKIYVLGVELFLTLSTVNDIGTTFAPKTWKSVMANATQMNAEVKDLFDACVGAQTIYIDGMAIIPDAFSNACDAPTAVVTTAGYPQVMGPGFSGSADQYGQFRFCPPKQWNAGTITAKFHWTATAAGSGAIRLGLGAIAFSDGDSVQPNHWGTVQYVTDTFQSVKKNHITSATSAITVGDSPTKGDLLQFVVLRTPTDGADTKAEKIYLLGIELTFTPDTVNDAGDSWSNSSWSDTTVYDQSDMDSRISAQWQKFVGLQTLYIDGMSLTVDLTNGCDAPATVAHNGAINPMLMGCGFSGSADQYAQFNVPFPKQWNGGTFTFRPHWTSHTSGSGDVMWRVQAVGLSDGDSLDTAFPTSTVSTVDTFQSVDLLHIGPTTAAITVGNSAIKGDLICFRVWRNPSNGSDTKAEKCYLLGLDIFFTPDEVNDE